MTLLLAPAGPTYDTNLNTAGGQNTTKQLRIISYLRRALMVKVLWCNKRQHSLGESAVVQQNRSREATIVAERVATVVGAAEEAATVAERAATVAERAAEEAAPPDQLDIYGAAHY